MIKFPNKHLIEFPWYMCVSVSFCFCDSVFALLLINFVSLHVQPCTDMCESQVRAHMQGEHTLAEDISEKTGELGQEVTRVSSIATGMERCVPCCEASQDEAKLRAVGPFCA